MKAVSQVITMLRSMLENFDDTFSSELRMRNYKASTPVVSKVQSLQSHHKNKR